jgi:Flp pilus assembly protein TadG
MTLMRTDDAMIQAQAKKHAQSQKGSVMVEFALILPMFLLLLFGVITFSIALYNKTVLTMATREGARAGAIHDPNSSSTSRAQTAASQVCQNNLITFGDSMTPAITTSTSGDILTVSANINYTGLYLFSVVFPISAETSMRLE